MNNIFLHEVHNKHKLIYFDQDRLFNFISTQVRLYIAYFAISRFTKQDFIVFASK